MRLLAKYAAAASIGAEDASPQVLSMPEESSRLWLDQQWDVEKAGRIQRACLPSKLPRLAGCQVSGHCQPASTVGGDYFDVLKFDDRKSALCIADAVGKGITGALLMAGLQADVKSCASGSVPPRELCRKVNRLIFDTVRPGRFITLFYCLLDTTDRTLAYTNAGHNMPILLRRDGSVLRLAEGGLVLGVVKESDYEQREVTLDTGDLLMLFTDGVTEAQDSDGEEFGEERLLALLAANRNLRPAELQAKVLNSVMEFSGGHLHDDTTLLVARFN